MSSTFDKTAWRETNVRFLESAPGLWDASGKLRYSYYELVGLTGSQMYTLLEAKLHTPKQFIGVDYMPEDIMYHRFRRVPWTTALVQDGYSKAESIAAYTEAQREELGISSYPVAIYGFDDQASTGNKSWWNTEASQIQHIVAKTLAQAGCCCFMLNTTLGRGGTVGYDRRQALDEHTRRLCSAFGKWGLKEEALLGPNRRFVDRIASAEIGALGGYEVYKSLDRRLPMLTVRLTFTQTRPVRVWRKEG